MPLRVALLCWACSYQFLPESRSWATCLIFSHLTFLPVTASLAICTFVSCLHSCLTYLILYVCVPGFLFLSISPCVPPHVLHFIFWKFFFPSFWHFCFVHFCLCYFDKSPGFDSSNHYFLRTSIFASLGILPRLRLVVWRNWKFFPSFPHSRLFP